MHKLFISCLLVVNVLTAKSQQINQYQYWYDADYSTLQTNNIAPVQDLSLNASINVDVLSYGLHCINMRFKSTDEKWSGITTDYFYKTSGTLGTGGYQYWFDNDFANAVIVNIANSPDYDLTASVNASSLINGYHNLNIRFKPVGGMWSSVNSETFLKRGSDNTPNFAVKQIKYWFDSDWQHAAQINRGTILSDSIMGNIDCENLRLGMHQICYQFMDNSNMWSGVSCDSFLRAPILYKEFLYPTITFQDQNNYSTGQTVAFTGEQFYPNGEITFSITKENEPGFSITNQSLNLPSLYADLRGKVNFNWATDPGLASGYYDVVSKDLTTGSFTPVKKVYIKNPSDIFQTQHIEIISPVTGNQYELNKPLVISWVDNLYLNPLNTSINNIVGITALRTAKYQLEYSLNSGNWIALTQNNGIYESNGFVGQVFTGNFIFTPTQLGTYKLRVTDLINTNNAGISNEFSVSYGNSNLLVDFVWDYSGNRPATYPIFMAPLQGVVADGTSRMYLKISKTSTNPKTLQSATVSLSDGISTCDNNNCIKFLGKVMRADSILSYSTEANSASSITTNSSNLVNGSLWFWYVAPDDFARTAADNFSGKREVIVKFDVRYSDGTTETYNNVIKIIRPPLMMVHGINSDMHAWDNLHYHGNLSIPYKIKDSHFLFQGGIQLNNMYPGGSFKLNAGVLLNYNTNNETLGAPTPNSEFPVENSFQHALYNARNNGYAANRVDYVCHSMGGCMARSAINDFSSDYMPSITNGKLFHNYGKGFINKLITINTPNNGSPMADEVNSWCTNGGTVIRSILSGYALLKKQSFVKLIPDPILGIPHIEASKAMADLQYYDGGKKFTETFVKNHLIVGKALDNFGCTLSLYTQIPGWEKIFIGNKADILGLVGSFAACNILDDIGSDHHVSAFSTESDLVVPLSSQLAGKQISDIAVSGFTGFEYNHLSVTDQTDVGDKVLDLLNTSINATVFANSIPANTTAHNPNPNARQNIVTQLNFDSAIEHINRDKIIITSPLTHSNVLIDSILEVRVKVSDTAHLKGIRIIFQNTILTSGSRADSQIFKFQIRPDISDNKYVFAMANYDSSGYTVSYIDTVMLRVSSISDPERLSIIPQISYLNPGQNLLPQLQLKYLNSYANINSMTDSITVIVKDTNVVYISSPDKSIIAKDTGSTYVIYQYRNLSDTMFLYISNQIKDTIVHSIYKFTGNGNWSNPANWSNNIKPPTELPAGSQIIIDPLPNGECLLDVVQKILPGAYIRVESGKIIRIPNNVTLE